MFEVKSTINTKKTEELLKEAKEYSPGGVQGDGRWYEPFPLFIKRAQGSKIWDVDDNEYIDYHGSYGPSVLGYNDPDVRQAVIETLENEGVLFATPHPKELELAKTLTEIIPCAEKVLLCGGGGSDPIYHAVRVSRAYTGKTKIMKFEGGYHGWHDYLAVSVTPNPADAGPAESPLSLATSAGSLQETIQQVVVAPFHDEAAVERLVEREKDQLAAIIIEPGHSGGCPIMRPDFLRFLRDICDKYGIVLIFDEVITGFRTHIGGSQALFGVTPDLGVFAKGMGNGFPIGALAGKKDIMSMFSPEGPVFFSGTYNGQIMNVAAAIKTIDLLRDGQLHKKLWGLGNRLSAGINAVADELEINAQCVNFGSIWGIHFARGPLDNYRDIAGMVRYNKANPKGMALKNTLLNNGIFVVGRPRGFISSAHSESEIDKTIDVITDFFRKHREELV